ncbi:MAG: ferrous iron transport protein A [Methanosaeta sp. PtaU1.Bin112]|nr:MAG: ferrous iron transport protein A [Methanosaeta sp. PtaU1.Bin112]
MIEGTEARCRKKKQLIELKPGEKGRIVAISASGYLRGRMMDMGLVAGSEVKVIRLAPAGDPVEVLLRGYSLALRRNEAMNIILEVDS